jgi:hypothetical protein
MGVVRRLLVVLVLFSSSLAGGSCAHHQKDRTVCPEYRKLRCVAGTRCSMDHARGCRVCQCAPLDQPPEGPPDDNARPPE